MCRSDSHHASCYMCSASVREYHGVTYESFCQYFSSQSRLSLFVRCSVRQAQPAEDQQQRTFKTGLVLAFSFLSVLNVEMWKNETPS